ncbi:MAG TPA: glycoside hydrolase family 65 protein [Candidatus Paenibacillus intestinavium]|nr:glycoside hydrolase family 65 protein [Candidatus Paenibacillus intestinavium]
MSWMIEEEYEDHFEQEKIAAIGNKYMIGNGYIGYRGTAEEFTKEQLTATIVAGLYDQVGTSWRELINAPNPLYTLLYFNDRPISLLTANVVKHRLQLDIQSGIMYRLTEFGLEDNIKIVIKSERFASACDHHVIAMNYQFSCSHAGTIKVVTGIDADVWDINGPHLEVLKQYTHHDSISQVTAKTYEQQKLLVVAEAVTGDGSFSEVRQSNLQFLRTYELNCELDHWYQIKKITTICSSLDLSDDQALMAESIGMTELVRDQGYEQLKENHIEAWSKRWESAFVKIEGNEQDQLALNYSLYQLMIAAPYHSEKLSIPARALSGQVYKGAVFWDTELFMLPFFLYTDPNLARNLLTYRVHTLEGAKRKAAELGYKGAFYAWESQDTGDDACTLFNVTDVFTGRPMRTYFRDKQIHISADVAYAILQYVAVTNDETILLEGGAEVILECARFLSSYAYYQPYKDHYELLDVTGPDEYHERVHNNVFTNYLTAYVLKEAMTLVDKVQQDHPIVYRRLMYDHEFQSDIEIIRDIALKLYLPQPNQAGVIEQFDQYFKLEDVGLAQLKERIQHPHEYLGGGNGLATTTQIIKQADVVLMLHLFGSRFNDETVRGNWDYYEPRTEHGSSLSPCVYAIVAAKLGYADYAYQYFRRTATIDLTGQSKLYVGDLYIGGTHPAANGGAWMAAIHGFAGFSFNNVPCLEPKLPKEWKSLSFKLVIKQQQFDITVTHDVIQIVAAERNTETISFVLNQQEIEIKPSQMYENIIAQ